MDDRKKKGKALLGGILFFLISTVCCIAFVWGIITFGDAQKSPSGGKAGGKDTKSTSEIKKEGDTGKELPITITEELHGLSEKDPATSRFDLAETIRAEILDGQTSITVYSKGLTNIDLTNLNFYLDHTYAVSRTFHNWDLTGGIKKTVFEVERAETYYVYRYFVYGEEIPASEQDSKREAEIISEIYENEISPSMTEFE